MTCSEIRPLLMDYIWRRLSPADAGAVDVHLGGCDACRSVLEEERSLGETLAAIPVVAPRRDLWETVRMRQMALDTARTMPAIRVQPGRYLFKTPTWRTWATVLGAGVAALALMMAPGRRVSEPAPGGNVLAQTLIQARQVAHQSDDPLAEVTDDTWDALAAASKDVPS